MSKQSNKYLWIVCLLCGCAMLFAGCRLGRRATPTPLALTALPQSLQGTPVAVLSATALVQTGAIIQNETYTGRVGAARQEDLFFRRSGRVAKVYVKDGDKNVAHSVKVGEEPAKREKKEKGAEKPAEKPAEKAAEEAK